MKTILLFTLAVCLYAFGIISLYMKLGLIPTAGIFCLLCAHNLEKKL